MAWPRTLRTRFHALFRKRHLDAEMDEEMRAHLELRTQANIEAGMNPEGARFAALRQFGWTESIKEECRDQRGVRWLENLFQDFRYGARQLRTDPGFTVVAVLTLALGIGVNTAFFSVINAALFPRLPYPESERLVCVYRTSRQSQTWPHSVPKHLDHKSQNTAFERMAAFLDRGFSLAEPGQSAQEVRGFLVSPDFFATLGVQPALGRVFAADEDQPGHDQVVVLSDAFWRGRFSGDTNAVGRTLRLDGETVTIIGIMPPGFDHPLLWGQVSLWRPMVFSEAQRRQRENHWFSALARMKPSVTLAQAQADLNVIASRLKQQYGTDDGLRVIPLRESAVGGVGRRLSWFTLGLAGFVLLIACVNLANLQLARMAARAREHAIRAVLGARRTRLVRQSLTESLVLALIGGAIGLLLAMGLCNVLERQSILGIQPGMARLLDWTVLIFASLISIFAGVAFGIGPALLGSRKDPSEVLRQGSRGTTPGHAQQRLRHGLIVAEVALALALMAGASLFLRGLHQFAQGNPGWRVDGLLTASLYLRSAKYSDESARSQFYRELERRLAAMPGVQNVGIGWSIPVLGFTSSGYIVAEGAPLPKPGQEPLRYLNGVSPHYFAALGIALVEGRYFTSADTTNGPPIVIINEAMARHFWPGQSALGKRIGHSASQNRNWLEIVGVVRDVRLAGTLSEPETRFQVYRPLAHEPRNYAAIGIRCSVAPEFLADAVRRVVEEIDPDLPVIGIQTARGGVDLGLANFSVLGGLLAGFALVGLLLAAVGIFGVMSGFVVQRTSEIGLRVALGASLRDVLWLMLGRGLRLALCGAAIGLVGAFVAARLLATAVPELPARDPLIVVLVTFVLLAVALVACWLPARHAARVDPMVALRAE